MKHIVYKTLRFGFSILINSPKFQFILFTIIPKMPIKTLNARQVFDSCGNPTLEVDMVTEMGLFRVPVPSGVTESVFECVEIRDNQEEYRGLSVFNAVKYVNAFISPELINANFEVTQQKEIDKFLVEMDGTDNKSKLGANTIYAISAAACKAGAAKKNIPTYRHIAELAGTNNILVLPVPVFNMLVGGIYSSNRLPIQDIMIMPTGAETFTEAMQIGTDVYHQLKSMLIEKYGLDASAVAIEGGFCTNFEDHRDALNILAEAIKEAGYWGKVEIAFDSAAHEFYKYGSYDMDFKNPQSVQNEFVNGDKLMDMYIDFIKEYPVASFEDPFDKEDYASWSMFATKVGVQIVGDELTVSSCKRIQNASERRACNAIALKPSQIGTISETIDSFKMAKSNGWGVVVTNRAGDTEDHFVADLVVGLSAGQLRAGAPSHSESLCKYNHVLRIEEELGVNGKYAGKNYRSV